MIDDNEWTPANDIWDSYLQQLEEFRNSHPLDSISPGELSKIVWPEELYLGEGELKDALEFVSRRSNEMIAITNRYRGLPPDLIYSYIMRSLLSGMLWQKDRIG